MGETRDNMQPGSGKILDENDNVVDITAILIAIWDQDEHAIKIS